MDFYANAMQVAPVLLITLFLDNRSPRTGSAQRWLRLQGRIIATANIAAFSISMFAVAGVVPDSTLVRSLVLAALSSSIGLLGVQVQDRLGERAHVSFRNEYHGQGNGDANAHRGGGGGRNPGTGNDSHDAR
jgi:hypothetical protein